MKIESIYDTSFRPYGQILTGYDTAALVSAIFSAEDIEEECRELRRLAEQTFSK